MKKILLATTMIVGGASIAAAEVTVSGDARMGIVRGADDPATVAFDENSQTEFTSRARVSFTLSGETDGGLSFGGSFRADNAGGAAAGQAGSVFISGAFGKLEMGDVSGAAEGAVGDVAGVGLTGLGDYNEALYLSNNTGFFPNAGNESIRPTARYTYSAGAFTGMASISNPNNLGTDIFSLGARYTTDAFTVGLGYENAKGDAALGNEDIEHVIVGGSATFSGVTVQAYYGRATASAGIIGFAGGDKATQYGLSASYTMDALTVTGYTSASGAELAGVGTIDDTAFGLGASYDLGGATVQGGVSRAKDKIANVSETQYDLGISFSF